MFVGRNLSCGFPFSGLYIQGFVYECFDSYNNPKYSEFKVYWFDLYISFDLNLTIQGIFLWSIKDINDLISNDFNFIYLFLKLFVFY